MNDRCSFHYRIVCFFRYASIYAEPFLPCKNDKNSLRQNQKIPRKMADYYTFWKPLSKATNTAQK